MIYIFAGALEDPSEGTVEESSNTLGLFDLFLQVEEESAKSAKRANGGALLSWPVAYGEEEEGYPFYFYFIYLAFF